MVKKVLAGFLVFLTLVIIGCASQETKKTELILATTTSTQDSGLFDVLIPKFQSETGYQVKIVAVGTGEALAMGERGDADVLLVHAPASEEELMNNAHGKDREAVMHNDFVLLGPPDDPVEVRGFLAKEAFKKISQKQAPFVSRADESGTHKKELEVWDEAGIKPSGDWYIESGQGMGESLKMASEKGAYILSDRGTYLAMRENLDLEVLVEKEEMFFNPYHVITVNLEKHKGVNYEGAKAFMDFLVSQEAQRLIGNFGKDKYGQPLFIPDALD